VPSALILVVLLLVLDVGVDLIGNGLFGGERLYNAIQLAVKNVTIIPFMTVWFLSIVRFTLSGTDGSDSGTSAS
jgi:hypothetical protein